MNKILLVNSNNERCGVFQMGHDVFRCLQGSDKFEITHGKFGSLHEFISSFDEDNNEVTHIILNKHTATLNFLHPQVIHAVREAGIKVLIMPHDEIIQYPRELIDHVLWLDPTMTAQAGESILGRPVVPVDLSGISPSKRLTVGFSGWCFKHKRIELLLEKMEGIDCFFNIHFSPYDNHREYEYEEFIKNSFNRRGNVKFNHDFLTSDELTLFLAQNTVNIFPYEDREVINRGISSITDHALASRRPFLLSDSNMFRHFADIKEKVSLHRTSIVDCVANYKEYLKPYWDKWTPEKMQEIVFNAL